MNNKVYHDYLLMIEEQLSYVKLKGIPGFSHIPNDISTIDKFSSFHFPEVEKLESKNEYLIKCPYAGTTVTIQMLFNIHEPWASPDFTIMDSDFMNKISIEALTSQVSCLNSWNYTSKDIIQRFLCQIIQLYKKYQLKMLEMEELLCYEYKSLLSTLEVTEEDVELLISGGGIYLASILIRLPIDLENVPPVLCCGNPGPPSTLLLINVRKNSGVIVPKMFFSPQVESLIGGTSNLNLPAVPPGSSLTDYAANLLTTVRNRIKQTLNRFENRKQTIAQLLCNFGTSIIEYDAQGFTSASFLFCISDFYAIATVTLAEKISESSRLILRSVYHSNFLLPFSQTVKDVAFDEKSPQATADNINAALIRSLPQFQKLCNESLKKATRNFSIWGVNKII